MAEFDLGQSKDSFQECQWMAGTAEMEAQRRRPSHDASRPDILRQQTRCQKPNPVFIPKLLRAQYVVLSSGKFSRFISFRRLLSVRPRWPPRGELSGDRALALLLQKIAGLEDRVAAQTFHEDPDREGVRRIRALPRQPGHFRCRMIWLV